MAMDPGQVCIGATTVLGCAGIAVQQYVLWGLFFFILGIIMATFIPLPSGKKIGLGLTLAGIVIMVATPYVILLWMMSQGFRIAVYSVIVFIIIMMVLFPKSKEIGVK